MRERLRDKHVIITYILDYIITYMIEYTITYTITYTDNLILSITYTNHPISAINSNNPKYKRDLIAYAHNFESANEDILVIFTILKPCRIQDYANCNLSRLRG